MQNPVVAAYWVHHSSNERRAVVIETSRTLEFVVDTKYSIVMIRSGSMVDPTLREEVGKGPAVRISLSWPKTEAIEFNLKFL